MAVITDIRVQKRRQDYYNIYIDGEYALALSDAEVVSRQLSRGQIIDKNTLGDMHQAHRTSKCYNCSLRYLALRSRSIAEVREYLDRRKGFGEAEIDRTIERLLDIKYLDDLSFARLWVRNRLELSNKPLSIVRLELIKKGVNREVIETCISEVGEARELECLEQLVIKKIRNPKYSDKQKLIEFLSRRGFKYSLIQRVFIDLALFENQLKN